MKFYSQAGQDKFVYYVLVKTGVVPIGTFLDIGCSHPRSNTLALEEIGWRGVLIDIGPTALLDAERKSKFIVADATRYDWSNLSDRFDYLSLDIDSATLPCLKTIPESMKFKVITIEHDLYQYPSVEQSPQPEMRRILASRGHVLISSNVCDYGGEKLLKFEDWWVAPEIEQHAKRFKSEGKYWKEIVGL